MTNALYLAQTAIDFLAQKHSVSSDTIVNELNSGNKKLSAQFAELVSLGIVAIAA